MDLRRPSSAHQRALPIGLLGLGGYLPERVMTNDDWSERLDTTDEWILARTGIRRRRFAADGETTADLATAAGRSALAAAGVEAAELAEIVVATDTPEMPAPDTAAFVQHRLGARQIPAYDLAGSGCAGFLQALDVARSRVACGREPILVIGVEIITRLMDWSDRRTAVLFGDAAAAAIVGESADAAEILGTVTGTDGSRADILGLPVGGTREPFTPEMAARGLHRRVVMDGPAVFREAVQRMSSASLELLAELGVAPGEVDHVVPHQANLRIIRAVAKRLDLPLEKFVINVEEYGNTGSASVPLALWEAHRAGRFAPGDRVLLASFGAGFHWGATLLRF